MSITKIPAAGRDFLCLGGAEWGEDRVSGGDGRDSGRFLSGFGGGGVFFVWFSGNCCYLCLCDTKYMSLSIFSAVCIFTRKIDDCPAYGGFSARETGWDKYGRDVVLVSPS